ncbi:MAG: DUF5615 family PIN-like protein [Thermodesulfobacteriota bacterium]|nr:DUF5615 family PIN-like protein [Thermodesulfobacteriota bacterium]
MKFLIDMNLSPQWVSVFENAGWEAQHWSFIGKPNAPDQEIFEYVKSNGYVLFTHDLDFGTILAATNTDFSSVIQIRIQDVTPEHLSGYIISATHHFEKHLEAGALMSLKRFMLLA